jgi:hypothetical protein
MIRRGLWSARLGPELMLGWTCGKGCCMDFLEAWVNLPRLARRFNLPGSF